MIMDRFARQYVLPGFGKEAQKKLNKSKILVIGAGGLGCPALLYLAAAGVGTVGIMDGDTVSLSNLNRQILFGESDLGLNKAETSAHYLKSKYSDIQIDCIPEFITTENAASFISKYDLILDGSDNFPTRYLVNDACVLLKKPMVFGAIYQNQGQVSIMNAVDSNSVNYRDLFPDPPTAYEIPNCNETGVLGVLPGIIGTIQAAEAIKYVTGYGRSLIDKMLFYNLLDHQSYEVALSKNLEAHHSTPKTIAQLKEIDYAVVCGNGDSISWIDAFELLKKFPDAKLIDVREKDEAPRLKNVNHISVPFSGIEEIPSILRPIDPLLLFCQSGVRSLKTVKILENAFPGKKIHSISGGIEAMDSPINKKDHGN
jgi:sulfur-carrier protein adenylyltransferase/sulfurtransferase